MRLSNAEELDKLGSTFTSKTQGFKLASMITSKPYSSKQFDLSVGLFCRFETMVGSTEIRVFRTIDFIYCIVLVNFSPILSNAASNYQKSHFEASFPSPSSSELSLFLTNLEVFFLFMLKFVRWTNF